MSTETDIAQLLNAGGVDSAALAEVIADYFNEATQEEERGLFTFLQAILIHCNYCINSTL